MGAGITVDIQAKVVGYQDSLRELQAAFSKIDPGSDIGKKLSKAFSQAENQVKSLEKNMFSKVSNYNQLDAIVERTNRAGESIQHIIYLMRQVGTTDLNLNALGSNITAFKNQISSLENELSDKLSKGLRDVINNSEPLKELFNSLGTNINEADATKFFSDLAKGATVATEELQAAEKNLKEVEQRVTSAQKAFSKVEFSPLNSRESKNDLQAQIRNIETDYNKVFDGLREHMASGLTRLKVENQDQILNQFFSGLTPENIKEKINDLFQTLYDSNFYTGIGKQREQFYNDIFFGGNNINSAIKNIDLQNQLDPIKEKFLDLMSSIDKDLTIKESSKVLDLLDQGNVEAAAQQAIKVVDSAFARIAEAYRKGKEALEAVREQQKKSEAEVAKAKANVEGFTQGEEILTSAKEATLKKEQELTDRLEAARNKTQEILTSTIRDMHNTANKTSSNLPSFPTDEAQQYSEQLERIQQRTQMIGKVQGVVQRWFSIYTAIRMAGKAIRSVTQTTKELDSTITEIAIVTKMDQSDLWGQMGNYTKLATKYAASISGVYKVSQLYYQQGLQSNEVMQLTEQTLKMARISGLDYSEATDYMTNAVRSFKMEMSEAATVVDVYSAVAASSASSVTELATAMSKTASSAAAVGSSFENTTAMLAVMIEATRESPENIGSAMKSIISRYGELKEKKVGVDEEGEEYSLNKVDKALQTVGISLHDAKGEFRDFDDVIFELAQKWNTIDKNTQRYIATIMAGNRQQSRFLALVSSAERLKEESDKAANSEDASQIQFLKTLDSVEAKTQQLQTSLQSLYTDSGIENLYKTILDFGNNIITTFSSLDEVGNFPILAISKFATMFTTIAVLVTNVFNLVKNQYKVQETLIQNHINTRLNLERQLRDAEAQGNESRVQELNAALNKEDQLYQEHMNKRQKISLKTNQGKGLLASSIGMIGSVIAANMNEETQRIPKGLLTGGSSILSGLGTYALMGGGPLGALMGIATALSGIIESVGILQETTEERIIKLKNNIEDASNEKLKSKDDLKTLTEYKKKYDTLYKSQNQSTEAKKEFIKLQNEIATNYPELISSMDAEGNYVVNMTSSYEQLASAKASIYNENNLKALSAELEALQDISYVLTEVYGIELKGNHNFFQMLGFGGGENNLDRIYSNLMKKESLSNLLSENTIASIFGKEVAKNSHDVLRSGIMTGTNRGIEQFLDVINPFKAWSDLFHGKISNTLFDDISGAIDLMSNRTKNKFNDLIQAFYNAAEQGLTLPEAQELISANDAFKDYADAINSFSAEVYKNFSTEAAAIKFQQDLIDKKITTALQEQISTLSSLTDIDVGNFQSKVISQQLKKDWEQYQKDVEAGQRKDASGNVIKKIGEKFTPEGESEEKIKTLADLYKEFINQYDAAWYYQIEQNTHTLNQSVIDNLYENKGQYSKQSLQQLSSFEKLGDFKSEFLDMYDEDFKETYELYDNFLKTNQESFTINNTNFVATLENFKNLVGPEFLQGIMDQYQTILDNESLTTDIKDNQLVDLTNILQSITKLQGEDQISALAEFQTADLTSLVGIYRFIDRLKDLHIDSGIVDSLSNLSKDIIVNINTELNTYLNDVASSMKDFESAISSVSKGMDFKSAVEMAQKLGVTISDFSFKNGEYYTDNFDLIKKSYLGEQDKLEIALQEASLQIIDNYRKTSEYTITNLKESQINWSQIRMGQQSVSELKNILSDNEKEFMEQTGLDANAFIQMYSSFLDNLASDNPITQFNDYIEDYINKQTKSATKESEKYAHTAIASAALAVNNLEEYFKNIFLANGNTNFIADQLTKIAKNLLTREKFDELLNFIPMGFRAQLKEYIDNAKDDFYEFFSLDKYGQTIEANAINEKLLAGAEGAGLVKALSTVGTTTTYEMMKITQDNIDDYIQFLESHPAEENKELLAEAYDWKTTNSSYNALKNVLAESFDYNAAQAFTEAMGHNVEETTKFMQDYGFIYDEANNQFKQTEESLANLKVEVDKLKQNPPENLTQEELNLSQELDHALEWQPAALKQSAIKDVIDNYQNLSTEQIRNLANALEMNYDEVVWQLTSSNLDGTHTFDLAKFYELIQNGSIEISKGVEQSIADLIESNYSDVTSQLEGVFDSNLSGGKYSSVIGKARKLLEQSGDSTTFLSDLIEYNEQTGGYILTSKAIDLEFSQLRKEESKKLIDAQSRKVAAMQALDKVSRESVISYEEDGMEIEEFVFKEINYDELRQAITESDLFESDAEREIAYSQLDALLEEYEAWSQLPENLGMAFGQFLELGLSVAKDNTQIIQDLINKAAFSYISGQDYESIASGQGAHLESTLKSLLKQTNPNMKDFDEQFNLLWADLLQGRFDKLNSMLSSVGLPSLSSAVMHKARQSYLQSFVDAADELISQVGEQVSARAAEAMQSAGYTLSTLSDGTKIISSVGNMVDAYTNLYESLSSNIDATVSQLNSLYVKVLNAQEQDDTTAIETLGNAMGMSYDALGEMLTKYGENLKLWLESNKDIYEHIGGGKIRITDFNAMARRMKWEQGSEEYISAFKAYNDSLIELNHKAEKTILEEVKSIESANIGDQLNLTQFMDTYYKAFAPQKYLEYAASSLAVTQGSTRAQELASEMMTSVGEFTDPIFNSLTTSLELAGATLSKGILEITDRANKLEILSILDDAITQMEQANKDLDFGDIHAQIKDSLNNITKSYFDSISKGMSGSLSYQDAEKLQQYAKSQAGKQLDFKDTAEGLQLTEDSFFSLYAILKKTNKLMAKKLLPDMTNISGKYKNLGEALDEYAKALENSDIEKADALRDLLDDMLANPDSYKLMDQETPSTWQSADNFYQSARQAYDVTQAMKSGSVGIGDFTAFAQSLIHSGNNEAKQMGLELLQKGADAIAVDKNGKSIVDTQLLAKILNVKNLDKWSSHYYDVWKNAAEDIQKAGVKQQQAYNTLFFGSEALDGADIYDKNGDISSQKINNLIKKQDTQGKNIEALLSKIKTNGKTLADVVKANKKLSPEQQAALKAIINTDWENGLIEEQLTDAFKGKKGKIVFKDDGTFTIDLDSDFSINYEFNGKEVNADDYSRLVSMKAREGYEDLTKTLSASQQKAGMQKHQFKLGNMKVIATINADSSVEYTIDSVTYSGEQINALDSALSQKNAEILESFTPYDNKKPAKKAVRYQAGDVQITMAITASGIIQYEGKVSGANGETQTVVGENEQDVIAMMAALGDLGAQKLITGLPHDDRTVSVNGQKYNIIVRNGITSIEFVNTDGSTSKNNFTEEAAKWWNNGNSTEPVNIPVDTPVEATATNVTIKVAEGATPTVDLGSVEDAPVKVPTETPIEALANNITIKMAEEVTPTVDLGSTEDTPVTISSNQQAIIELNNVQYKINNSSDSADTTEVMNIATPETPSINIDANIEGVKNKINEVVSYAQSATAFQRVDAGGSNVGQLIEANINDAANRKAFQRVDSGGTNVGQVIAANVQEAASNKAFQSVEASGNNVPAVINYNVNYAAEHPAYQKVISSDGAPEATGNVSLSKGNALSKGKTLMGELGQELVVSHGRYYIVGANGPEMVNLDDDAIVFNHIQTRQLLKNGRTPLHGRAVTNELEAAGMAHSSNLTSLKEVKKKMQELNVTDKNTKRATEILGPVPNVSDPYALEMVQAVDSVKTAVETLDKTGKTLGEKIKEEGEQKKKAEVAKQAAEERGKKLTEQTKTKYDEGKDAINQAILKENRAKYDLSLSMGEKANLVREAKELRNSDAAKFYQQIEQATFQKVIKPAQAAAEASADAAQQQQQAAQQQSQAAKEQSQAADATKQAASSVKGMRNEWASQQDPRGGLTAPGNLVHPNAAPKLADVFGGTANANADASKKGNSYINDSLRGTGNTLNRNIDPALAGYYKKNGGNAAGGGGSNEDNAKALKEAKSAVSSFLSDLLSLGIESIDLSKYEKLPGDIKSGIQERLDRNDSYRSFVEAYASALDKSMSEINETYFQAWQKDLEAVGLAEEQMESLEGLSFYANGEIGGSSSDWTTILGDKAFVGDAVKAGIFEWNAVLRQYIVQDQAALEQFMNTNIGNVWNFPEVAIDQAQSVTDELNELLTKSISEGLSAKDKARAEELAAKQGYEGALDFSQDSKNKFRLKDSSITGISSLSSSTNQEVTDIAQQTAQEALESILSGIEDSHITKEMGSSIQNWLEQKGESLSGLVETDTGWDIGFESIPEVINKFGAEYKPFILSIVKSLDTSKLNKEQLNSLATALSSLGNDNEVKTIIANLQDNIYGKAKTALEIIAEGFGKDSDKIISESRNAEMEKAFADLGIDISDISFTQAEGGIKSNWDTICDIYGKMLAAYPEAAVNFLKSISDEELTMEQQKAKADALANAGATSAASETRDAIVTRIKDITDTINNAFGEDNIISFSDFDTLADNLASAGISTDILNSFEKTATGYIIKDFKAITAIYDELYAEYPEAAVTFLKNISDDILNDSQKQAKATMLEAAGKVKESAELLDGIINDRSDIISILLKSIGEEGINNTEVTDLKDKWKRAYDVDFDFDFGTNGNNFSLSFDQLMSAYNTIKSKSAADAKKFLDELPKAIDLENLTAEQLESYRKAIESAKATGAITTSEMNKAWAPVYDAMRERLMTSIDLTSKAISGTATYSDIEDLKDHLKSQNNLGVTPEEIESRIQTYQTEEGVRLIQDSYDWLIEIYSRVLPKKANELITTANETLISDLEYQEQATEGALQELRSNWTWDSYSSLFTVSRDNLAKYASMRGVTLDESIFEDALRDKEGNYKLTVEQIEEYIGLFPEETRKATNKWFQEQGKITRKNIADALNGIIDTLIEKGANEIDFTDYDDLQEPIKDAISSDVFAMSKADIVKKWASELQKTVQETNELYFKAWEADLENNAVEAAKGMQYYLGGGLSGSSSDWTSLLGNNIKVSDLVESGLLSYNEKLNTYVATSLQSLQELGLDSDLFDTSIIEDSIRSLFDNILEQVSKAMNEGLTNLEVDQFMENLNLSGINLDLTFKQTVDGLKLSKESAIALYEELKKVDAVQAQLMFKKLNESLKETDDHYKNITKILARIKELQDQINEASQFDETKINQYQQELNLAKEILAVRATSEDDSFDVANRALPGGLKNALTYANSLSDIAHEFRNAFEDSESDIIDFQMFYNMANEINDAAGVLGKSINFFGYTLDGGIDNLDSLITHAADSLGSSVDGNKFGVSLTKFGNDLSGSMDSFAGSADKAMHTMAETQIQILDGLIAMFEVIVAMEEFEGADLNANGLLDFNEVFNLTGLAEDTYSSAVIFNSKFSDAAQVLLDTIDSNDEYKEIANKIKLNGHTLYEIFSDAADGIRDILDVPAETYAQMVSSLYELLKSGDFDLDDIYNSMKEAFLTNQSGYEGTVEIGNILFNIKYKAAITKLDDGTYQTPSGAIYTNEKDAAQGLLLESIGAKDIEFDEVTCTSHGTIKVGQSSIDVEVVTDSNEAVTYNAPSGSYTSLEAAIEGEWHASEDGKENKLDLEEWKIDQKITVVPVVSPKLAESDLELDQNQINAAIGKTYDEIKAEWDAAKGNKEAELHFEATYGVAFNDNTTEADWVRFKELAGIKTENIELNASINIVKVDGVLNQLLSTNPDDKKVALNVEAPTDLAEKAVNLFKQTVDNLTGTVDIDANTNEAKSQLQEIIDTVNNIDTSIDIDVNVHQNGELPSGSSSATGTIGSAMAAGTQTLMGELGPELYVTNGKYHLAGENGAEFVNLPDDAIVFNHLQTQRLLQNGSTGRGKPVTNERKAVAMARGSGPAAASARQTLATLKQMRAMWQSLADMSVTELAGMTIDNTKENIATWIQQVEKWYTLLQKIATLEKKIIQEQKIRAALQSKLLAAGDLYAESQLKSLKATSEQLKLEQELAHSYLDEFNSRRKELNENGPFSRFYTFDENGQPVYRENGLEELTELFNPQYENNGIKYTAEEQVALAKAYGLGDFMKKDSEGKTLVQEEGESSSEFAVRQLDALKYSMDKQQADLQSYYDSWYDHTNTALDLEESRNQILQEIRDNQIELEDKVLQAVEEREQAIIDKLSDEREALSKANENYIKSLQDTLDKERKLYEANENEQEVKSLQRRLSILQRSGGSQSEISSLQKELQEKTKDLYFDAQEDQINTLQDASDAQLEKLDKQIELMTESLEYAKANGLLWNDVYKVMSGTSEQITAFITTNMSDWKSKSTLAQEQEQKTLLFIAQQFETYRKEDQEKLFATPNNVTDDLEGLRTATNIDINEKTEKDYNKINKEAEIRAANGSSTTTSSSIGTNTSSFTKTTPSNKTLAQSAKETKGNSNITSNRDTDTAWAIQQWNAINNDLEWLAGQITVCQDYIDRHDNEDRYRADQKTFKDSWDNLIARRNELKPVLDQRTNTFAQTKNIASSDITWALQQREAIDKDLQWLTGQIEVYNDYRNRGETIDENQYETYKKQQQSLKERRKNLTAILGYRHGGMVTQTGLVRVHGTDARPEAFMNADEVQMWKQDILGSGSHSLTTQLVNLRSVLDAIESSSSNIHTTVSEGVTIEHAEVNMNVEQIANDYDARRAGASALDEMLKIARKAGNNSIRR